MMNDEIKSYKQPFVFRKHQNVMLLCKISSIKNSSLQKLRKS